MKVRNSASSTLPAGYRLHGSVDLKRDRKQFVAIQVVAVLIVAVMVGPVLLLVPPPLVLPVFVVAVLNFAGSSGDYIQTYSMAKLPPGALIRDDGRTTTVFLPAS
jgi:hypothetical protein